MMNNLVTTAKKIMANKWYFYVILLLSVLEILNLFMGQHWTSILVFAIVSALTHYYTKNKAIILTSAFVVTRLLRFRQFEGLENRVTDPEIAKGIDAMKSSSSVEEAKKKIKETFESKSDSDNMPSGDDTAKPAMTKKTPRLDYASTLEQNFQNLDKILNSEGIRNLTNDTKMLMQQQQELFKTMATMTPLISDAKSLLKNFDMESLGNMTKLAGALTGGKTAPAPKNA